MNEFQQSPPPPLWSLLNHDTDQVVVSDLRIADGYWSRLAGLQFRRPLAVGRGLLLVKSASIHTFWMRFAIDVAFVGIDGRVLGVRRGIRPWRAVLGVSGTHAILETTAGWIDLEMGDRLFAYYAGKPEAMYRRRSMSFLSPATPIWRQDEPTSCMEPERRDA